MTYRATLVGSGMYAPRRVMTNDEIATMVETSDEWIYARTGIRRRRIAAPEESTSTLAIEAGRAALASAGLQGEDIDLTIVATCTPDYGFPASACLVQDALGTRGGAFDLEAACSGFVYALSMASALIGVGGARRVLVIGSEVFSRVLNWRDRSTCILFGDGAGAVIVARSVLPGAPPIFTLGSDGSGAHLLVLPPTSSAPVTADSPPARGVTMNGPETFKFGVRVLADVCESIMRQTGLGPAEIQWLVPHQANQRIIGAGARRAGFADAQVMSNIEEYGNTSAASIPLAIADWVGRGVVQPGHRLLVVGFGAGLTWAGGLIGWRE